jgi:hypothetical protein
MTRAEQLACSFDYSRSRITNALAQVQQDIEIAKMSDRAFTGRAREDMRRLMLDEIALAGTLERMRSGAVPEQLEFDL